jgi:hypothetical protein
MKNRIIAGIKIEKIIDKEFSSSWVLEVESGVEEFLFEAIADLNKSWEQAGKQGEQELNNNEHE